MAPTHDQLVRLSQMDQGQIDEMNRLFGEVREKNPSLAALMESQPEIADLFFRSKAERWDSAQWEANVRTSNWFLNSSPAQREWQVLQATDPGAAGDQWWDKFRQVQQANFTYGFGIDDKQLTELVSESLSNGYDESRLMNAMGYRAKFTQGAEPGQVGATMSSIRESAYDYGVEVSDKTAWDWAISISRGSMDMDGVAQEFKTQAQGLYAGIADDIERGFTVRQIAEPYMAMAAKELELDPSQIDFRDPKWRKPLDTLTADGTRMTMSDWRQTYRTDEQYGFNSTKTAEDLAAVAVNRILKKFGAF